MISLTILKIQFAMYGGKWSPHEPSTLKSQLVLAGRHVNTSQKKKAATRQVEMTMKAPVVRCIVRWGNTRR